MKDHAVRAVRMAWEMQREIEKLNVKWAHEGREAVRAGMGIHTGFVTVGNFGSEHFTNYTVIGRAANLAARIEAWAPAGRILLSSRTRVLVHESAETRLFAELILKGISEPVPVFEVLGIGHPEAAATPAEPADQWLVENGGERGPFPQAGVEVMRQCGRIGPDTLIRRHTENAASTAETIA